MRAYIDNGQRAFELQKYRKNQHCRRYRISSKLSETHKVGVSSQLGRKDVQEYQAYPVADDSGDERKMYKAQMSVDRKD